MATGQLRTCERSWRLNGPGGTPTSSFKFRTSKQAFTFAILKLCTPHLRTAVHPCNTKYGPVPSRYGTNTCIVTPLVIKYIEPGSNIPSRTTITTRVEASYVRKKAELKTQLATANVTLTTDCGTSLNTESYITITCHYIEPDWCYAKCC